MNAVGIVEILIKRLFQTGNVKRRGISLEEMSEYLGDIATVSTISKWMSGMHLPERKVLQIINEKLRLTKMEYEDLVESYNEVVAGETEYNDYCLVRNLINKSGENKCNQRVICKKWLYIQL